MARPKGSKNAVNGGSEAKKKSQTVGAIKPHINQRDLAFLRLNCLKFVVENDNQLNRSNPVKKASEYLDFVLGNTAEIEMQKPVEVLNVVSKQEVEQEVQPAILKPIQSSDKVVNPFNENRKSVIIN